MDRYLTTAASPEQIVGRWIPLERSLHDLKRAPGFTITHRDRHQLEFEPSGSCRFRTHWQYSYVDAGEPEWSSYFDTSNCGWKIGTVTAQVGTSVFEAPAVLIQVRQHERTAHAYYFMAWRDDRLLLWQSIGEPVWGYHMEFVKAEPAASP